MSAIRDKIAEAICGTTSAGKLFPWNTLTLQEQNVWRRMADSGLDAQREACTITTTEQIDALPIGSVVQSLGGTDIGDIYVNWADHHLAYLYGPWFRSGYEVPCPSDEVDLPARILWHPDWSPDEH